MKKLSKYLAIVLSIASCNAGSAMALIPLPTNDGGIAFPTQMSFDDLSELSEDGSFQSTPELNKLLGFDPSRSWKKGSKLADVIKTGDITEYGLQRLSLAEIAQRQGLELDPETIKLNDIGLIQDLSLEELANSVPNLKNHKIKKIPVLSEILGEKYDRYTLKEILDEDLSTLSARTREDAIARTISDIDLYLEKSNLQAIEKLYEVASNIQFETQQFIDTQLCSTANPILCTDTPDTVDLAVLDLEKIEYAKEEYINKVDSFSKETKDLILNELSLFINENPDYNRIEITQFTNETLNKYRTNLQTTIEDEFTVFNNDIKNSINQDINLEKITELESKIDKYKELKTEIDDFISQNIEQVNQQIDTSIDENIGALTENLSSELDKLGDLKLSDYDLSEFTAKDLTGIENAAIENFSKYENVEISEIPNARTLAFGDYPSLPPLPQIIGTLDLVLSNAEKFTFDTISGGGADVLIPKDCNNGNDEGEGCSHVEIGGFLGLGNRWVMGGSQRVNGGKNALADYGGGDEPVGRLPFPKAPFKMVLRNVDEQADTVEMFLAFNFCATDPSGTEHCTPYNVFEVPIFTFTVGNLMYLGI